MIYRCWVYHVAGIQLILFLWVAKKKKVTSIPQHKHSGFLMLVNKGHHSHKATNNCVLSVDRQFQLVILDKAGFDSVAREEYEVERVLTS